MLAGTWYLGALLALAIPGEHAARQASAIELDSLANTVDGSVLRDCRLRGQVEGAKKYQAWLAFGEIRQGGAPPLEVSSATIHCQTGSSSKAGALFGRILGAPYLIVDIDVVSRAGKVQATVSSRKFSEWDRRGRPTYTQLDRRTSEVDDASETVVPILVASSFEKEAFRVEEIFLRFRERPMGEREAAYGAISVTADTPGGWLLLDGGRVSRILETGPTHLENVLVGVHEVGLRDLSGREARKSVRVEKDGTSEVTLALREPPSSGEQKGLVPVGRNPQGQEEHWRTMDGALVVTIPAGETWMGSDDGDGEANERPRHRVFVSAFRIDKTEVTWRQVQHFARETGTPLPPAPIWGMPDDFPASNVTWEEADAYCKWVGGRLPTEAEWEKANRGTEEKKYPWGNEWAPGRCNSFDGGPHRPENVGSFPDCTSPYGVLDMPGSVWEWCGDWYSEGYDPASARDPVGADSGSMRVVRGGSWINQPSWLRGAYRYRAEPWGRHPNQGFRCAQASGP